MPRGGQNKRKWSEKELSQIEYLAGLGMTHEHIAALMGVSHDTIARHLQQDEVFAAYLLKGKAKAASKVMQTAFNMASSGKNPTMTIFWLKTRCGWKSQDNVNLVVTDLEKFRHVPNEALLAGLDACNSPEDEDEDANA